MPAHIRLIYDKQCPACDYYCHLIRIRETVGRLVLVMSATVVREWTRSLLLASIPIKAWYCKSAIRFTMGLTRYARLRLWAGTPAFSTRALTGPFRSQTVSRLLYPILKACRNLLLKSLGKTKINNLGIHAKDRF